MEHVVNLIQRFIKDVLHRFVVLLLLVIQPPDGKERWMALNVFFFNCLTNDFQHGVKYNPEVDCKIILASIFRQTLCSLKMKMQTFALEFEICHDVSSCHYGFLCVQCLYVFGVSVHFF